MAAAALTETTTIHTDEFRRGRAAVRVEPLPPLRRAPLPAGRPRAWYEAHNRRLKAMRLAIALLDTGVYRPASADNGRIRDTAARIGVHPPSDTTCRMVRALIA
ncbi:hypothetical protein [Streptomyces montanisoli]|uniref:hypothetical protein n=1 Tax=Streptomyces montanisoli TaxID=2798581 RepID=UPI001FD8063E|nr:hypothetical protein [Streptomyces montanisoli]